MEELEQILREHAKRYPKMQPTDAVKLLYQNEFGGGHLIKDAQACLDYLRREYASVEKDTSIPLYEDIGSGIVRVNLAAVNAEELELLGQAFLRSAAEHTGSPAGFLKKLDVLHQLTAQGIFAFGTDDLDAYLAKYKKDGYPAVSHSREYREAYAPAYRIVLLRNCLSREENV